MTQRLPLIGLHPRRADPGHDEKAQHASEADELRGRAQCSFVRQVKRHISCTSNDPDYRQNIDCIVWSVHQVGDDDSRCEAGERLEGIELRGPCALRHPLDATRKLTRIMVVAQSPTIRPSPSVPGDPEANVRQQNRDQHTPQGDGHFTFQPPELRTGSTRAA